MSADPDLLPLEAGPWTALFSTRDGALRHLKVDGEEALLAIYAAVRDADWNTVAPELQDLRIEERAAGLGVCFRVVCRAGEVDFRWRGSIDLWHDGRLRYVFEGESQTSFRRNRIGICVLHPASCAGRPVWVEPVEGTATEGRFPAEIQPHQPFRGIRSLTHPLASGVLLATRLDGEVFEMEDQRNWTDASFKTYCTPLALPFPVQVAAGTRILQSAELRLSPPPGTRRVSGTRPSPGVDLEISGQSFPMPRLGLQAWGTDVPDPSPEMHDRFSHFPAGTLRVEVHPGDQAGADACLLRLQTAARLGWAVVPALHLGDGIPVAEAVRRACQRLALCPGVQVDHWLVFRAGERSTGAPWTCGVRAALQGSPFQAPVYGGTDAYFAELNRQRPAAEDVDGLVFSINPQVHAFDDLSLLETLAMHQTTVRQAASWAPGKPVEVSPISLLPRFNPNATTAGPSALGTVRPSDPRQHTAFAALWTLLSLRYGSAGGAASMVFHETHGPRGVIDPQSPRPSPLEILWRELALWEGARLRPLGSSNPLLVDGCVLCRGNSSSLCVANLGKAPTEVRYRFPAGVGMGPASPLLGGYPKGLGEGAWELAPHSLTRWEVHL